MLVNHFGQEFTTVLILTEENAYGEGSRLPGVFVSREELHIRSSVNGVWNHLTNVTNVVLGTLKEGTWVKVEVQQMYSDNKVRNYESISTI